MVALELSLKEFTGLLEHTRPVWGKRSTPEKRRERLMQQTLIKPNLVHWTRLGIILVKALASVHP